VSGRPPAPLGVVTGARLWLLRHVAAGRVRWLTTSGEALLIGDEATEVTSLFGELVRSGWARIVPYGERDQPMPAAMATEVLPAGEDVLIEANRKRRR